MFCLSAVDSNKNHTKIPMELASENTISSSARTACVSTIFCVGIEVEVGVQSGESKNSIACNRRASRIVQLQERSLMIAARYDCENLFLFKPQTVFVARPPKTTESHSQTYKKKLLHWAPRDPLRVTADDSQPTSREHDPKLLKRQPFRRTEL